MKREPTSKALPCLSRDTRVDPCEQVAFYDPGLGSASDGGHFKIGWMRWLYLACMATGFGITRNIVDCYAAIISLYEEGDRIFLVDFSRGAYTVHSVAGVITYCGIPRHRPDGSALRRAPKSIHMLAEHAVKSVYQCCLTSERKSADTANSQCKPATPSRLSSGTRWKLARSSLGRDSLLVTRPYLGGFATTQR